MPYAVPYHDTYMLYTDDGQEFDMYPELFSPMNIQYYTSIFGSEVAAHEALQVTWNQLCQGPQAMGLKPVPGSTSNDVQIHQLFRNYSVRIWGAGLESWNAYYFDFVDPLTSHPVNLPLNWRIFIARGTLSSIASEVLSPISMHVKSMEARHGLRHHQILLGQEKYMQTEGTVMRVVPPSGEEAFFQLPIRRSIHIKAGQALVDPFALQAGGSVESLARK